MTTTRQPFLSLFVVLLSLLMDYIRISFTCTRASTRLFHSMIYPLDACCVL